MEESPMRRISRKFLLIILSSALAMAISGPAQAKHSKADVITFFNADGSPAAGDVVGEATLKRSKEGVNLTVHTTGLGSDNAYSIWWVIFNNPDACAAGCAGSDLENPAVEGSVMNATGRVADFDGNGWFSAFLPVGFMHTEPASGNIRQIFGPGLQNLKGAEIHVVIRCHGPWTGNVEQISTLNGDCMADTSADPEGNGCFDIQAAAFPKPKTKPKK
jgi:hypothetical protein